MLGHVAGALAVGVVLLCLMGALVGTVTSGEAELASVGLGLVGVLALVLSVGVCEWWTGRG